MSDLRDAGVSVHDQELALLATAQASQDRIQALLRAVETIAVNRMQLSVFSASRCLAGTELERIYSSRPDLYRVGAHKSKRQTTWADRVIRDRQVFVGEGPLEMAAAFDDQEMVKAGIGSIINVPIVLSGKCAGVLNFGCEPERVLPGQVLLARFLALAATPVFLPD